METESFMMLSPNLVSCNTLGKHVTVLNTVVVYMCITCIYSHLLVNMAIIIMITPVRKLLNAMQSTKH